MTHTLITVLGKGQLRKGEQTLRGYQPATYDFGNEQQRTNEFFGLALAEQVRPNRLVVLGTSGSMWDVLLFSLNLKEDYADALLDLTTAADADSTEQAQLDALEPVVSERLGCEVLLRLIPYGKTPAEQTAILQIMAAFLQPGDRATLDITHGLRHLPMLIQMGALYLRKVLNVTIEGIYYGALDMVPRDQPKPVMNLQGLLDMADWITALSTFDKDGDYAEFAPLLEKDGLKPVEANHLRRAAFYERTSNARDAVKELANFGKTLEQGLPGIGELFAEPLRERTQWQRGRSNPYEQQRHLAEVYLHNGDYIRAAIFAYEALVTRLTEQNQGNPVDYQERDAARRAYESDRTIARKQKDDYWLLNNLRNTLAHGNEALDPRVPGIVGDEKRLRAELQRLLKSLLS